MTKFIGHNSQEDFPIREEVVDFSGKPRVFIINCHEGELGFTVRAQEAGKEGLGYEFAAYSETSPYAALYRVRQKMYRGLATRHITKSPSGLEMLHDELRGRITWSQEDGAGVIVDGIPLTLEELGSLLASHEGWQLQLRITDSLE